MNASLAAAGYNSSLLRRRVSRTARRTTLVRGDFARPVADPRMRFATEYCLAKSPVENVLPGRRRREGTSKRALANGRGKGFCEK
jgi:hypothetical protein